MTVGLGVATDRIGRGGARPGAGRKKNVELGEAYTLYNKARAKREVHQAKIAEMDERRMAGDLVEIAQVRKDVQRAAMAFRDAMLAIPGRLAAQIASLDDERDVEQMLDAEIRAELGRIADGVRL